MKLAVGRGSSEPRHAVAPPDQSNDGRAMSLTRACPAQVREDVAVVGSGQSPGPEVA